jgi:hypothetical protein
VRALDVRNNPGRDHRAGDHQRDWQKLWADVAALLTRLQEAGGRKGAAK